MNGDNYFIVLGVDQECAPQTLNYSGSTVGITLMADGAERTVQLFPTGVLFTVESGVTLTLERNVTLNGLYNVYTLVRITSGGRFTMNGGKISGNTTQYGGGGVSVTGMFYMYDGEISGNTASSTTTGGGGVYADGIFSKSTGGVVYGSDAAAALKNISSSGNGDAVFRNTGSKKRNGTIPAGMTFDSTTDAEWD